jgi:hypothetical protein
MHQDRSCRCPLIESLGEYVVHFPEDLARAWRKIAAGCESNDVFLCLFDRNVLQRSRTRLGDELTFIIKTFLLHLIGSEKSWIRRRDGIVWSVEYVWDGRNKVLSISVSVLGIRGIVALRFLSEIVKYLELTGVL